MQCEIICLADHLSFFWDSKILFLWFCESYLFGVVMSASTWNFFSLFEGFYHNRICMVIHFFSYFFSSMSQRYIPLACMGAWHHGNISIPVPLHRPFPHLLLHLPRRTPLPWPAVWDEGPAFCLGPVAVFTLNLQLRPGQSCPSQPHPPHPLRSYHTLNQPLEHPWILHVLKRTFLHLLTPVYLSWTRHPRGTAWTIRCHLPRSP